MNSKQACDKVQQVLSQIGVTLNGSSPWDVQIKNDRCYQRIMHEPSLGLGESYMDGDWECQQLDELFFRILRDLRLQNIYKASTFFRVLLKNILSNQQSLLRSRKVAEQHYNLSLDLYQPMLGNTMAYTCGYWQHADNLDAAQYAKYDLVCRKANLRPGENILELGCGWGGFAKYAAEKYGVEVTAVNISSEQIKYAREINRNLPVQLHECDYRAVSTYNPQKIRYDKVISIGMCEHVGYRNYKQFLHLVHQQLKEEGLFVLHTIGKNRTTLFSDPWMQKYIFPNGMLPTIQLLSRAAESHFVIEDLHNFGANYDKTLMAWDKNFVTSWPEIKKDYDERFYRMWRYYLLSCAGSFRSRSIQLWQFVLSPRGELGGYQSIR